MVGHWWADSRDLVEVDSLLEEDVEGKEMVDIVKPEDRIDSVRISDTEVRMNWEVDIRESSSVTTSCLAEGRSDMTVWIDNRWNVFEGIL